MEPTLAQADSEAPAALRRFSDLAGSLTTPEGHRVRGLALARWADMMPGSSGGRARAEAVRELLDGGDKVAARRVLEAHSDSNGMAQGALIQLLIADNQLDLAEERLSNATTAITADDRAELRLALARARIGRGELDRAVAALADDSSVAAIAQRGWIALYRGDLKSAMAAFRLAGPYATDRAAATDRTAMMALLQRIQEESSPELGAALLTLARGDSVAAVTALRRAAARLPAQGGRLEVLLLAGQVASQKGGDQEPTAIALFDEIVRTGGEGAAPPAAELEWSRLLVRNGRSADAILHLEHLILTYPNSAFVPEARRVLERAKGAIPKS
jgi:tetratricopeptide (TPR) repeat protein